MKRNWNCFPGTFKRPDQPEALDELERTRQIRLRPVSSEARDRPRGMAFVGNERDKAQALAREWYRQQNDTGFAYQAGKKNFDTLVKEAEQEILGQKINEAQRSSKNRKLELDSETQPDAN